MTTVSRTTPATATAVSPHGQRNQRSPLPSPFSGSLTSSGYSLARSCSPLPDRCPEPVEARSGRLKVSTAIRSSDQRDFLTGDQNVTDRRSVRRDEQPWATAQQPRERHGRVIGDLHSHDPGTSLGGEHRP